MIEQFSNSARALTDSVPEEVRMAVDEVVEGKIFITDSERYRYRNEPRPRLVTDLRICVGK